MSIQITIAEPMEQAREVAVETRKALTAWVAERAEQCGVAVVQPLLADRQVELKEEGKILFENAARTFSRAFPLLNPKDALFACIRDFQRASALIILATEHVREDTYRLEGLANAFSKAAFTCGTAWAPEHHWCAWNGIGAPDVTSGTVDQQIGELYYGAAQWSQYRLYGMAYRAHTAGADMHIKELLWDISKYGFAGELDNCGFTPEQGERTRWNVMAVPYMDEDGPWVAGFLSPRDLSRYRFSRKRLGAWLKECGQYPDEMIRTRVEGCKVSQAGAKFVIYPNDVDWSELYQAGAEEVDSCMTHSPSHWSLGTDPDGDDAHPISPYSAAYWGAGDNGLALFTAVDDDENMMGRGIFNIHTGSIVRWYAGHSQGRALRKLGMDIEHSYALQDSWLALIKLDDDCQFLHPYVDGTCYHGEVVEEEQRVYLRSDSGDSEFIDLEMTGGSSFVGDSHYCEDVSRDVLASRAVYQEITGNYVTQAAIDEWTCPVIREWVPEYNRFNTCLDGVMTQVSRYARNNCLDNVPYDSIPKDVELDSRSAFNSYVTRNPEWAEKELLWQIEQNPGNQQLSLDLEQLKSQNSLRRSSELAARTAELASASLRPSLSSPLRDLDFSRAETQLATSSALSLSPTAAMGCDCADCQRQRRQFERYQLLLESERAAIPTSYFGQVQQAVDRQQAAMTTLYGSTVTGRLTMESPQIQELPRQAAAPRRPIRQYPTMIWDEVPPMVDVQAVLPTQPT